VATWRVDGRTLHGHEVLRFPDRRPDSVSLQFTEAATRPLHVDLRASTPHRVHTIDTAGIAEDRSAWGELPVVHQIDADPDAEVELWWSVTPRLRLASDAPTHHYHRSLYEPLADRVVDKGLHRGHVEAPARGFDRLRDVDVFHLHWPEWLLGADPGLARAFVDLLAASKVRLVWTQHNLVPHEHDPAHDAVYATVAAAADAVLHHSAWGRDQALARWRYRPDCRHAVVPHGHFGDLMADVAGVDRAAAEADLGLRPAQVRFGIVGAPRRAKHTVAFMEAFVRSTRPDVGLAVFSLGAGDPVPDDPRIAGRPYAFVDRAEYNRRLATIDVLVLPIDPDGEMLTTGVIGDAVGLGRPVVASSWPFFAEALGDAALVYEDLDDVPALVDALDDATLERLAAAAGELRERYAFSRLAEELWSVLVAVGTDKL
jgi:glycosyltransferase involved in cell wall biosynthesis